MSKNIIISTKMSYFRNQEGDILKSKSRIFHTEKIQIHDNQRESVGGITSEYPYVMHYSDLDNVYIPWHWHNEVEFGYVLKGELDVVTINRKYHISAQQGYFINSNILSSMHKHPGAGKTELQTHLFHPVFLGGHFQSIYETKYINPVIHNTNIDIIEIKENDGFQKLILQKLKKAAQLQEQADTEFQTRNIFSDIWLLLLNVICSHPVQPVNLKNQDRIQTMLSFIHLNYGEKISLDDIASSAAVSSRECLRCFHSTIRKSPSEYLTEYRLEAAKKLLLETEMNITEISLQCGFSSNAYFGKIFREKCGETPSRYRTRNRNI